MFYLGYLFKKRKYLNILYVPNFFTVKSWTCEGVEDILTTCNFEKLLRPTTLVVKDFWVKALIDVHKSMVEIRNKKLSILINCIKFLNEFLKYS